ncbi:hypothetical protein ACOME3_006185 [Neoechinorhynchus agilis]
MISTMVLASVDFIPSDETSTERIEFMSDKAFEAADVYVDIAWILSTFLGLFLFLIDLALVCWIKFQIVSTAAAIVASAVIIVTLTAMSVIVFHLRLKMSKIRMAIRKTELRNFQRLTRRLPQTPTVVAAKSGRSQLKRKRRRFNVVQKETPALTTVESE